MANSEVATLTSNDIQQIMTTDYKGSYIFEDGNLKTGLFPGGYMKYEQSEQIISAEHYYYNRDYLGNNRDVVSESSGAVVQRTEYLPSGTPYPMTEGDAEAQPYKHIGKEFDRMHGLDWFDFHARMYDPVLYRFLTPDPLAEKYYSVSPYAYCGNNPVRYVDPDGREISFSYEWEKDKEGNYVKNQNGGYNLIGVTMNVTGKVINVSSNSGINMIEATKNISSQIESSFSGKVDGVTFSSNVNLSVANSMEDVAKNDHLFALVDPFITSFGNIIQGASSSIGGKVAFIDADYFTGLLDTSIGNVGKGTAAHEFGHLAGLKHTSGLMMEEPGGILRMTSTKINNDQLVTIHEKFKRGSLNKGPNYENVPYISPYAGGTIMKRMPYRGIARPYISY